MSIKNIGKHYNIPFFASLYQIMQALVDTHLQEIIKNGQITHLDEGVNLGDFIQPASIDLPIGKKLFHVNHKFLPFQKTVANIVESLKTQELSTEEGVTLYKGQTYLIPCLHIDLPDQIFGKVSPKSSLGRIDVLIRAVVDTTGMYDTLLPGTQGNLWLEVTPQSFNIKIHHGTPITQLMLFDTTTQVASYDKTQHYLFIDDSPTKPQYYQDHMVVHVGVGNHSTVGYKARYTDEVIDLSKRNTYEAHRFFEEIHLEGSKEHNKIILEQGRFYILPTHEKIRVPKEYSIELLPFTHLMGELRVHYAGFFDPGFGGEKGATGVLEVRPHEDIIVYDGQPICLMEVFTNKEIPNSVYGESGNTYQGQEGPRLAKYFAT